MSNITQTNYNFTSTYSGIKKAKDGTYSGEALRTAFGGNAASIFSASKSYSLSEAESAAGNYFSQQTGEKSEPQQAQAQKPTTVAGKKVNFMTNG